MPRAHSVHLVCDLHRNPLAAFTVKHECRKYLERREKFGGLKYLMVYRLRDNDPLTSIEGKTAMTWLRDNPS